MSFRSVFVILSLIVVLALLPGQGMFTVRISVFVALHFDTAYLEKRSLRRAVRSRRVGSSMYNS